MLPHIDLLIMSFRAKNPKGEMVWCLSHYLTFFGEPIYWRTFGFLFLLLSSLIIYLGLKLTRQNLSRVAQ